VFFATHAAQAADAEPAKPANNPTPWEILSAVPPAICGNPGAVNVEAGNGFLQSLTRLSPDTGVKFGGIWLADYNILMSGGAQPGASSWNSLLIASVEFNAEKFIGWKGADFGVQFLQFNGQNTNGQAGSVQGYNGLPGLPPLDRSELYQAWYRQRLLDDHLIIRIGRSVPTYDFNNVLRPVTTQEGDLEIPSVSGLLYTPIFVNPTMLGSLPGYYNSANGLTVTLTPTKNSYINYGFYDGNLANGTQTGLTAPQFNGYYFNILEAGVDWVIADKYPGQFGAGLWYQTGVLTGPGAIKQSGTGGFYLFGGQRVWGRSAQQGLAATRDKDGKSKIVIPASTTGQNSSVSIFYQFGVNNSETLPVNQYFGGGVTGFGLVPNRPADSIGFGMAWSWLNPHIFNRSSELMFQGYYQAHLYGGAFIQPTLSYIPTPGASSSLPGAWAMTMRFTLLF
jgi:porin